MSEEYNGYLITEQGGHKFIVTRPGDEAVPVQIFHWPHDAKAWIDQQPPPPPETRKKK